MDELLAFIQSERNSAWIRYPGGFEVYVRNRALVLTENEGTIVCLTFANLDTPRPGIESAYWVLQWILNAEKICKEQGLGFYVENIWNPVLESFFKRRGYIRYKYLHSPCYYKTFTD